MILLHIKSLTPQQCSIVDGFADVMRHNLDPLRVAAIDQEAAAIKEKLLKNKGLDLNDPQVWFSFLEGAKLFDEIIEDRLKKGKNAFRGLAEFNYDSQDDAWMILAALAPTSVHQEFKF
jgi:hypothetical protein